MNRSNSVRNLQNINFSILNIAEQIVIKTRGRDTPNIKMSKPSTSRFKKYTRKFNASVYKKYKWLTGCAEKNALFCFPCILFGGDPLWTKIGVTELKNLCDKCRKHESNSLHLKNSTHLSLLGYNNELVTNAQCQISTNNDCVKKNRVILSKIINSIQFCIRFNLLMQIDDLHCFETDDELFPRDLGLLWGLLESSNILGGTLMGHYLTSNIFNGKLSLVLNDLLNCIFQVCQEEIIKEIEKAKYVSIMVYDITEVSETYHVAIIFRYVLKDRIYERFWGLFQLEQETDNEAAKCITDQLQLVLKGSTEKLISQSCDHACLIVGVNGGMQGIIKQIYPNAHFTNSYDLRFDDAIKNASSRNKEARIFFNSLTLLKEYLCTPEHYDIINSVSKMDFSQSETYNFQSEIIPTLVRFKKDITYSLNHLQLASTGEVSQKAAIAFKIIQGAYFTFWLNYFNQFMAYMRQLFDQIKFQKESYETALDYVIQNVRFWGNFMPVLEESFYACLSETSKRQLEMNKTSAKHVVNFIVEHTQQLFLFSDLQTALKLFIPEMYTPNYSNHFHSVLETTVNAYPCLDKQRLKDELTVLYSIPTFKDLCQPWKMYRLMQEMSLGCSLKEVNKLLKIVLTAPLLTWEVNRCFDTSERLKAFTKEFQFKSKLPQLAMCHMEKELILDTSNFNEKVIAKFAQLRNRKKDFNFK